MSRIPPFASLALRSSTRGQIAFFCCIALAPTASSALWWPYQTPRDYEECSERAEKTATSNESRSALISLCDIKFSGRRKIDGGYVYYDFMQNRHFDIAGPNPTPEELKRMDEQYIVYLDQLRRSAIAAAFAEKQRQQTQADFENDLGAGFAATDQGAPAANAEAIPCYR